MSSATSRTQIENMITTEPTLQDQANTSRNRCDFCLGGREHEYTYCVFCGATSHDDHNTGIRHAVIGKNFDQLPAQAQRDVRLSSSMGKINRAFLLAADRYRVGMAGRGDTWRQIPMNQLRGLLVDEAIEMNSARTHQQIFDEALDVMNVAAMIASQALDQLLKATERSIPCDTCPTEPTPPDTDTPLSD